MKARITGSRGTISVEVVQCVRMYHLVREGISAEAARISVGRNLYPPCQVLRKHILRQVTNLIESPRISQYESDADALERALVAELLGMYLERSDIKPCDIFFTQGAQEGISIVCGYAAQKGLSAVLPLPMYYSFEQSCLRWGMPVAGYYRSDGTVRWNETSRDRNFLALIVPNAVTGTFFSPQGRFGRRLESQAEFTLVDCVFQLGAFSRASLLAEQTLATLRGLNLEHSAVLFTASKDLSLPALRAGVLVTRDREAMQYAQSDRFERLYSISPLGAWLTALYLGVLLINKTAASQTYADVRSTFRSAGLEFPGEDDVQAILDHIRNMTLRNQNNLTLLTNGTFPLELNHGLMPIAGFSAFPRILREFAGSTDFIQWIKAMGVNHRLKINPSYLFGAKPEIWEELYPDEYRIRVNLSEETGELLLRLKELQTGVNFG